ncbi:MAG: hypothetical protein GIX03_03265 [Candidatus Eremiobacteraeota bacterium]|nr:hypothetical protein [Candidatus Eremiobacteraeota bacterium]MBC5802033.1 hypothetical protein [Candidatus Eremiobacteraeota bacterium]MBC5822563.1 hypothetical protein [Candidatus Eremiobacteraeota bacterium]
MRALWLLEVRYLRHQIAAIGRSPLRLMVWIVYALAMGAVAVVRSLKALHHHAVTPIALRADFATAGAGLYLALLGTMAAAAAFGRITPFRNAAEPVLFSNAGLRPVTMAVWLQARKMVTGWLRSFAMLIYALLVFSPPRSDSSATLRAFAAAILVFGIAISLELPTFLLARGRWKGLVRGVACAVAALGFAYGIGGLMGERIRGPLVRTTQLDPGLALAPLLAGDWIAMLVPLLTFALLIGVVAALGNDALPELYAASQRTVGARQRARSPALRTSSRERRRRTNTVPRGALALVWKDWITFRRVGGAFAFWLLCCAFWAACGAGTALLTRHYHDATPLALLAGALGLFVIFIVPYGASAGLVTDLGKPLFWLSPDALRLRLAASTLARAWRLGTALGLAPLAVAVVFGDTIFAAISLPAGIASGWALQALGVGLYALFPNPLDARGPIGALRTLVTIACFIPPALVAAIVALLHGHFAELGIAFAATLACEGWLAIELAAFRLREGGAALAAASR